MRAKLRFPQGRRVTCSAGIPRRRKNAGASRSPPLEVDLLILSGTLAHTLDSEGLSPVDGLGAGCAIVGAFLFFTSLIRP